MKTLLERSSITCLVLERYKDKLEGELECRTVFRPLFPWEGLPRGSYDLSIGRVDIIFSWGSAYAAIQDKTSFLHTGQPHPLEKVQFMTHPEAMTYVEQYFY